MADTTFIDRQTPIYASWLNDVNRLTYDLPSSASGKGASLVGHSKTGVSAPSNRTVRSKFDSDLPSVLDFDGIDPSGASDSSTAFRNAFEWALKNDTEILIPAADPLKYYRLDSEVGIDQPDTLQWGRSLNIRGMGAGSRIVVNHAGHGFRFYSSAAPNDARVTFDVSNLTFRGGAGDFAAVKPATFIYTEFGINPHFSRLRFMSSETTDACIKNLYGYGALYDHLMFRGVVGNGVRLRQDQPDTTAFSHVQTFINCSFDAVTGKALWHDAGNCLNILGGVFEKCGTGIFIDPTGFAGMRAVGLNIMGAWFEKNTDKDIDLVSNSLSWTEASVQRCQFSGNGATPGIIDLGARSRIVMTGYPIGNNVEVRGNTAAGFVGFGTSSSQVVNVGVPFWAEIDPLGTAVFPQTLTVTGQTTTSKVVAANGFVSQTGTTSLPNGVATTIFTMPSSTNAVYLLSTTAGSSGATAWTAVALISCSATMGQMTVLQTATNVTLTRAGVAIQATQSTGGTVALTWTVTRIQ